MKAYFDAIAAAVCRLPPESSLDRVTLNFTSEMSEFVRFNRGAVRQMTHVEQHQATVTVLADRRRAAGSATLGGDADIDIALLVRLRDALAADLPMVPPDPHLLMPDTVVNTFRDVSNGRNERDRSNDGNKRNLTDERSDGGPAGSRLPPVEDIVALVIDQSRGVDLVGFYAAGPVVAAFADSRGQRNWHRVQSFHLDWSLYCSGDPAVRDRAVKSTYAGSTWDGAEFLRRMDQARTRLALLERPARRLEPGAYRAWLEPAAVAEMLGTLAWGGFGIKERRTGTSTLMLLESGAASLAQGFSLSEAPGSGIAPVFTSSGYVRPDTVPLVCAGRCAQALVSPRSAAEFGLPANADGGEYPASLALAGGALDDAGVLAALDTGLWIGNLWYLSYSDRRTCRMTGMTRFASFWVERGEVVAPIDVMRFDDSFLRLFGDGLIGLSRTAELLPSNDTYGERHLGSITTPGALLADMRFTL